MCWCFVFVACGLVAEGSGVTGVLDAAAGNRTIWTVKNDPRILHIDIEPDLEIPADRILDCRNTGFPDKSFHTIIFDPPHSWGHQKGKGCMTSPNSDNWNPAWGHKQRPAYTGNDKYGSEEGLIQFISASAREFHRLLVDDGWVLLKWGETRINSERIVSLFVSHGFVVMLRTDRRKNGPAASNCSWVLLMKKLE